MRADGQNVIFCPLLGTIAADSRFASARAAPGFGRDLGPFSLLPSPAAPAFRSSLWGIPLQRSFGVTAVSTSGITSSREGFGRCVRSERSGRFACGGTSRFLGGAEPSSRFALGAPRRTASAPAYSTTNVRPLRWWFLGLTSAVVACSIVVKSINAKLQDSQFFLTWTQREVVRTLCIYHCLRMCPFGLCVAKRRSVCLFYYLPLLLKQLHHPTWTCSF